MDKKNMLVIAGLVLVIAVVAVVSILMPKQRTALDITVTAPGGVVTTLTPEPNEKAPEATAEDAPASDAPRAWLIISVDDKTYAPYPLTKTGDYTINQKKKRAVNVVHVTESSVMMASSTCSNQLCVAEGEVTLENKEARILGNYIVCLPNGVTLELLNEEEYTALMAGSGNAE